LVSGTATTTGRGRGRTLIDGKDLSEVCVSYEAEPSGLRGRCAMVALVAYGYEFSGAATHFLMPPTVLATAVRTYRRSQGSGHRFRSRTPIESKRLPRCARRPRRRPSRQLGLGSAVKISSSRRDEAEPVPEVSISPSASVSQVVASISDRAARPRRAGPCSWLLLGREPKMPRSCLAVYAALPVSGTVSPRRGIATMNPRRA